MRRILVGLLFSVLMLPARGLAKDAGRVAYGDQLHPPAAGEGAAPQFSAYTFAVMRDTVIFYGFSVPDRSLLRINTASGELTTLATPENFVAHDMVAFEGKLYMLQDRGSLEHRDRFILYELSPSGGFRQFGVRHGLATFSNGNREQAVMGGACLGADFDGIVFVMDTHDGRFITVIMDSTPVPLEAQEVRQSPEQTTSDRSYGVLQTTSRHDATGTYVDCWILGGLEGTFKTPELGNTVPATDGRVFQPVLHDRSIEFWSATTDARGITFHRYPIGG